MTEKVATLAEAEVPEGIVRVCESCLERGCLNERLECQAAQLEEHAQWIRTLTGRLQVPTFKEWQDAEAKHTEEVRAWYDEKYGRSAPRDEKESGPSALRAGPVRS